MNDDTISRRAAIDEIDEWIEAFKENGHKESAADAHFIKVGIGALPSAQPERKMGRWIVRYECPNCGEGRSYAFDTCPMCGRRLIDE